MLSALPVFTSNDLPSTNPGPSEETRGLPGRLECLWEQHAGPARPGGGLPGEKA